MKHIVSFSGGIGSYVAARRVVKRYGIGNVLLVFTDVKMEDEDLYRFIDDAARHLRVPMVKLADGRTPWELFRDLKFVGNTRIAQCSKMLKSDVFYKWVDDYAASVNDDITIYYGMDWTESHRIEGVRKHVTKYRVEAPLCERPFLTKQQMFDIVTNDGIELPRAYKLGFAHNNCSFCCVKAGLGQWKKVWELMPERYAHFEKIQEDLHRDVPQVRPFLRKTEKGVLEYITLKDYRERYLEQKCEIDEFDIGGCGCFVETEDSEND